jgi:phage-related protein
MSSADASKPLFWVGSSRKDIRAFPLEVRRVFGFALWQAQLGGRHLDSKVLKGFGGAGVLEMVEDYSGDTYRAVYTVRFSGVVYVLHAFQKKSKKGVKTPTAEIETIRRRLKAAEEHHAARRTEKDEARKPGRG